MSAKECEAFADYVIEVDGTRIARSVAGLQQPHVLEREFVATAVEVEGRMVDVRLVPFGEVARVADPPNYEPYDEEWLPGCFDHQLNAANRVHAKYGHSPHAIDVVGHGTELRRESDGYHVTSKIHRTPQGETALELIRDGALPCVSLEARGVKAVRNAAGVVQRVKAHLTGFAFCQQGAFAGAQVMALREQPERIVDEALVAPDMSPDVVERCRRLGIALPQRYQAHPAGTPSSDGTPETAPAEDDNNTSSEDTQ